MIVVEENHSSQNIIGNPNAPFINSLAAGGANMTGFFAETHPSQPNYLAMYSGSTQGVTDDSCPQSFAGANLGSEALTRRDRLRRLLRGPARRRVHGVRERWLRAQTQPVGGFSNVPGTSNQPFSAFPSDYSTLPAVSYVVPNQTDDMHDGTIAQGDSWLQNNLAGYITWANAHNSVFVLTFDEDDLGAGNQIPTVITGQGVQQGNYPETLNHYNLLRTIEDAYGLAPVGASATARRSSTSGARPPGISRRSRCSPRRARGCRARSTGRGPRIRTARWCRMPGPSATASRAPVWRRRMRTRGAARSL